MSKYGVYIMQCIEKTHTFTDLKCRGNGLWPADASGGARGGGRRQLLGAAGRLTRGGRGQGGLAARPGGGFKGGTT